jgi:hypothetical protein
VGVLRDSHGAARRAIVAGYVDEDLHRAFGDEEQIALGGVPVPERLLALEG